MWEWGVLAAQTTIAQWGEIHASTSLLWMQESEFFSVSIHFFLKQVWRLHLSYRVRGENISSTSDVTIPKNSDIAAETSAFVR